MQLDLPDLSRQNRSFRVVGAGVEEIRAQALDLLHQVEIAVDGRVDLLVSQDGETSLLDRGPDLRCDTGRVRRWVVDDGHPPSFVQAHDGLGFDRGDLVILGLDGEALPVGFAVAGQVDGDDSCLHIDRQVLHPDARVVRADDCEHPGAHHLVGHLRPAGRIGPIVRRDQVDPPSEHSTPGVCFPNGQCGPTQHVDPVG